MLKEIINFNIQIFNIYKIEIILFIIYNIIYIYVFIIFVYKGIC